MAVVGTYIYMLTMIIPHTLASLLTKSGNLPHVDARYWARWTLWCSHVKVTVEGQENLPDGPAVYMGNHSSYYDVLAILARLMVQFRWIVKRELYSVPILGLAMKRAGYIMVDRSDHAAAMASMDIAARKVAGGTSIFIFPEGTRSADGRIGFPFKKGGFHLAMKAGVPIVPISISGSVKIMPKNDKRVKPGPIVLKIGQPIPTHNKHLPQLMEEVYKAIKNGYILPDEIAEAAPIIHRLDVQAENRDPIAVSQR